MCQLLFDLFAFREERETRAKEVQTRGTNQRGRTTTEASDQGSDQGLHVGFFDAGLQKWESDTLGWTPAPESASNVTKSDLFKEVHATRLARDVLPVLQPDLKLQLCIQI